MKKFLIVIMILALSVGVCFAEGLKISKPDQFVNYKIGTQRGTIAEGIAKKMLGDKSSKQLVTYEKATDVMQALKVGKIDCAIMDEAPALQFKKNDPDALTILPDALTVEQYAIGFKQGNKQLLDQVNKALAQIKAKQTVSLKKLCSNTKKTQWRPSLKILIYTSEQKAEN